MDAIEKCHVWTDDRQLPSRLNHFTHEAEIPAVLSHTRYEPHFDVFIYQSGLGLIPGAMGPTIKINYHFDESLCKEDGYPDCVFTLWKFEMHLDSAGVRRFGPTVFHTEWKRWILRVLVFLDISYYADMNALFHRSALVPGTTSQH